MTTAVDPTDRSHVRRDLLLLSIACAAFFLVRLGARDLWNPNEPIYGEAVREMAEAKTWLVPQVNGLDFGEKPILYFWMALVSVKLLGGVSEFSLRLPSVFGGIAVVLGAYLLALPYAGRVRALAGAVALATTYAIWWLARAVAMDILLTAATVWAVYGVTRVLDSDDPPWKGWLIAGVAAGVGFNAKGPIGWICPGLAVFTYAIATRRVARLFGKEMLLGWVACFAVAAPWYVALAATGRTDILHEVLIRQNFQRYTDPWDHVEPFWFYVPYYFIEMAPWSFFSLLAWRLPDRTERDRKLSILALCWIVSILVFFSASKSKRDPYITPAAPAVVFLAVEVLERYVRGTLSRARRLGVLAIVGAFAALFVAGGAWALTNLATRFPETAVEARWLGAFCILTGLALGGTLLARKSGWGVPTAVAAAAAALYLTAGVYVLPAVDTYKSAKPLCESVTQLLRPGDRIASYEFWRWRSQYRYYLERPIEALYGNEALRAAWDGPDRVVLFVEEIGLDDARHVIGDRKPALIRSVGSMPTYVFINR
ncbi:MAG TPA: glycosyltransferase family 39 protein [Candidatus Sulfotelmatobacter sp.]|nr:glycosyltransferase family 39 protein [Candidatus Sulfotelmatobacter sp.]